MKTVDVVIVSYRSRDALRATVEPLAAEPDISIVVVDNASGDGGLEAVADLPVVTRQLERNVGFAAGCNEGWRLGSAPYVLFLNPDAHIEPKSVRLLAAALDDDPVMGVVAPLIRSSAGELEYSQRRFPRIASTFSQALFLHRLFPYREWVDELVRDPKAYAKRRPVDWVSGACLLVRRELLERIGGWDERFFMYCEDVDLCKRIHDIGFEVVFEPAALAVHAGGASAPRASLLPVLAASKVLYAEKHESGPRAVLEQAGIVLSSVTHAIASTQGTKTRRGYIRAALRAAVGPATPPRG
ncbi:MAG: glycosyltransferase family 2 protein [Gaiellaceae bacterium]